MQAGQIGNAATGRPSCRVATRNGKKMSGRMFVGLGTVLVIYAFAFRGPTNIDSYPSYLDSPYRLPFEAATSRWCVQGNRSTCSHRGQFKYSYDFLMPIGTPVVATRGGKVVEVKVARDGIGNFAGNRIVVEHSDGTLGYYVHLKKDGSVVEVGDTIRQGQVVGQSGMTGRCLFPHIHFHVERDGEGVPFTFAGLGRHRGIPRTGYKYTSQ